jgi:hypothetical protein
LLSRPQSREIEYFDHLINVVVGINININVHINVNVVIMIFDFFFALLLSRRPRTTR